MIGTAVIYRDKAGALRHALVVHVHEEEPLVAQRGGEEQVRSALASRRALNLVVVSTDAKAIVGDGRGTLVVTDVPHATHAGEGETSWQELVA